MFSSPCCKKADMDSIPCDQLLGPSSSSSLHPDMGLGIPLKQGFLSC